MGSDTVTARALKVAAIQYDITGGLKIEGFFRKVERFVLESKAQGAELLVFPEVFSLDLLQPGTLEDEIAQVRKIAFEDSPRIFNFIGELARRERLAILAGTTPRPRAGEPGEDSRIVNTALLALADGTSHFQDKLFLTACEKRDWKLSPGAELKVIHAPWGKTVICICYDSEIPLLSHLLAEHRPELILVPSCTGATEGFHRVRWCAQARAIEHHSYVVHTGTVGSGTATPNMETQFGQAAILTPSDKGFARVLAEGAINERGIIFADLDLERLRRSREVTTVYPAQDQLLRDRVPSVREVFGT